MLKRQYQIFQLVLKSLDWMDIGYGNENATLISNMDSFQPVQGAIQNIFSNSFINDCSSSNSSKYDKTMTPPCHFEEPTIRTPLSQTNFVDHTDTINATEHEDSLTRLCIGTAVCRNEN